MSRYLSGSLNLPPHMRLMFPLRLFHVIGSDEANAHDLDGVQKIGGWADRHVTSLDEFLEAVFIVLRKGKERGAVGLKDQSAYSRSLSYDVVPRCDAERLFNRLLSDPRNVLGWPEAKPLDDFLFHQYMRFARELDSARAASHGAHGRHPESRRQGRCRIAHAGAGAAPGRPLRPVPRQLAGDGAAPLPRQELPECRARPLLAADHRPALCRGAAAGGPS